MNGAMNGGTQNGGLLLEPSSDAEVGFVTLNIGPSSAEVPQQSVGGNRPGMPFGRSPSLGRATSSKKCIIVAVVAAVTAIALGVGLGVGLGSGGGGGGTGDMGDAFGAPSPSYSPTPMAPLSYRLMRPTGATTAEEVIELPEQCVEMAIGAYFDTLNVTQYDLTLTLEPAMFKSDYNTPPPNIFNASVIITFNVTAATSCVVLNAKDIGIYHVELLSGAGGDSSITICEDPIADAKLAGCTGGVVSAPFQRHRNSVGNPDVFELASTGDMDLVAIYMGEATLQPGEARLSLTYAGALGNTSTGRETGLLRSAPFLANATTEEYQVLVYTQGAQNGARQILPCYDQPRFKAIFNVTTKAPASVLEVLTNMGCDGVDMSEDDMTVVIRKCDPTPPMSPYLLAIAAGHMVPLVPELPPWKKNVPGAVEGQDTVEQWVSQLDVRVWTVHGNKDPLASPADLAALVAEPALAFYARFLNVPLDGVTKFDLLAVPGKTGAMENWGLLLFDERRFLYDKKVDGSYDMLHSASVICHEIAHQWFGNLATKQDWTMSSLDEGLASFMEYKCMDYLGDLASNSIANPAVRNLDKLVEAMQGQNLHLLKNTADVTFFRSSTPQLQMPGVHDAPGQLALLVTADPTHPPAVPQNDLTVGTGSYAQYAKPALLLRMYELFLDEFSQALNVDRGANGLPSVLGRFLNAHTFGTWNWGSFFKAAYDTTLETQNGNVNATIPQLIAARSESMWNLETWEENRALVQNAIEADEGDDSHSTMATWFYSSTYPIFSFADKQSLNATSYIATTQSFGLTSRPFCSFDINSTDVEAFAGVKGVTELAEQAEELCRNVNLGTRFFPSTIAFDQMVDCSRDDFKTGNWTAGERWANLSQEKTWVDSQMGAKLFRSVYHADHLTDLMGVLANMTDICDDSLTVDKNDTTDFCCTRQSDLLEGAALLSDAAAVAMSGNPMAELPDVDLTITKVLGHVEKALTGGDKSNGQWQYLIGGAAADVLFQMKRMDEFVDVECSADFAQYILDQLQPLADTVADEWLPSLEAPPPPPANPGDLPTPPSDLLKHLAGPRLLWQVGMLEDSSASDTDTILERLCHSVPGTPWFKRYLLRQMLDLDAPLALDLDDFDFSYNATDETVMDAFDSNLSPDLLPAFYMAAASFPLACKDAMSAAIAPALEAARAMDGPAFQNATQPRDVGLGDVVAALKECYLGEAEESEAERCLYALPVLAMAADDGPVAVEGALHAAVEALVKDVLPWLLGTLLNRDMCQTRSGSNAQKQLCAQRSQAALSLVPSLLTNAARVSSHQYAAVLTYLQENWDTLTEAKMVLCTTIELLPPPATADTSDQLTALLTDLMSKGTAGCPATTYVRAVGKAKQFKILLESQAKEVCTYVSGKVAGQGRR